MTRKEGEESSEGCDTDKSVLNHSAFCVLAFQSSIHFTNEADLEIMRRGVSEVRGRGERKVRSIGLNKL